MSPFILHRLGDTSFGIWILVFSLSAYYGLFDFGILAAVPRYVARFVVLGDERSLTRFVNTSLAACGALGLAVLAIAAIAAHYLGSVFKIPTDLLETARVLAILVGADAAFGFPLSVFGCILEGYQAYENLNLIHISAALFRGLLIFLALTAGGGLRAMAFITVSINVVRNLACAFLVRRLTPIRLAPKYIDRSMLRELSGFGLVLFILSVAENLRFQSDAIVIGAFLSSAAITHYSIGSRLSEYPSGIVNSMAQIFTPMASEYETRGDYERLRRTFVAANQACALVMFPLCAVLIALGKPIIAVWVGSKYVSSYPVLLILVVSKTLFLAQAGSARILMGLGRLRPLTWAISVDGAANLVLSVALLRRWGIMGVALGTAIPLAGTSLFFLPRHLCRLLGIQVWDFLRRAYLLPLGLTTLMTAALLLLKQLCAPQSYLGLSLDLVLASAVYGGGWLFHFLARQPTEEPVRLRFARLWQQILGRRVN